MEKENHAPAEQPSKSSGDAGEKGKVAYESFQKVLGEKKQTQEKLSSAEAELKALREEKLQREGKSQELIDEYRKTIEKLSSDLKDTKNNYAWSTVKKEIRTEAEKHGCTDSEKLIRLMDNDDLKTLSENIGDDFSINKESLKNVIEKNKKDNFFLFSSAGKTFVTGNPNPKSPEPEKKQKDLKEMTTDEIKSLYKQQYK